MLSVMSAPHAGVLAAYPRLRPRIPATAAACDCSWLPKCNAENPTHHSATRQHARYIYDCTPNRATIGIRDSKDNAMRGSGHTSHRSTGRIPDRNTGREFGHRLAARLGLAAYPYKWSRAWPCLAASSRWPVRLNDWVEADLTRHNSEPPHCVYNWRQYLNPYLTPNPTTYQDEHAGISLVAYLGTDRALHGDASLASRSDSSQQTCSYAHKRPAVSETSCHVAVHVIGYVASHVYGRASAYAVCSFGRCASSRVSATCVPPVLVTSRTDSVVSVWALVGGQLCSTGADATPTHMSSEGFTKTHGHACTLTMVGAWVGAWSITAANTY